MKLSNKILALGAVAMLAVQAVHSAQYGLDPYMGFRAVLPSATPVAIVAGSGAGGITNGPVDTVNWIGDAKFDVFAYTNAQVNTVTLAVNTSSDTTNWSAVASASLATQGTLKITNTMVLSGGNYYFGTNFIVTDTYLYPFVITTPTAFSAGYATPSPLENPFTNTSPFTLNGNGWTEIAVRTPNLSRYLQFVYTASGSGTTNVTASAIITVPTFNPQP